MPAGFISEWWPASNRNGGRLHVGKPGRNKSESATLALAGQFKTTQYRIFQAYDDLTRWETDPEARMKIDEALAAKGHSASTILAQAYMRGATQIDAIDRRIAAYERRRDAALRAAASLHQRPP